MSLQREISDLVRLAQGEGWTVSQDAAGHAKLIPPDGGTPLYLPLTPSDHRGVDNAKAMLRQAGLDVPHKGGRSKRIVKRSVPLRIQLSEVEEERLNENAKRAGMHRADYVRSRCCSPLMSEGSNAFE